MKHSKVKGQYFHHILIIITVIINIIFIIIIILHYLDLEFLFFMTNFKFIIMLKTHLYWYFIHLTVVVIIFKIELIKI